MLKSGRKGRIPNELVAASCAAILAVYAAGSWRTRDEDRRFGTEGPVRRPVRPVVPAASPPAGAASVIPDLVSDARPVASEPPGATPKSLKVEVAPLSVPAELPPAANAATPAVASGAVDGKSDPAVAAGPEAVVAVAEAEAAEPTHKPWLDGYYTGWGMSRHGDLQAFVRIVDGRITEAGVATCETRYPCSVINQILHQPVELQGPDVDRVSRATESADAYYSGLVTALENAETGTFKSVRP